MGICYSIEMGAGFKISRDDMVYLIGKHTPKEIKLVPHYDSKTGERLPDKQEIVQYESFDYTFMGKEYDNEWDLCEAINRVLKHGRVGIYGTEYMDSKPYFFFYIDWEDKESWDSYPVDINWQNIGEEDWDDLLTASSRLKKEIAVLIGYDADPDGFQIAVNRNVG